MVRWILLALLVVGLTTAATVAVQFLPTDASTADLPAGSGLPPGPKPAMAVAEDLAHEFGRVGQGTIGSHTWTVRNDGQADLVLTLTATQCGCTSVRYADGDRNLDLKKPGGDSRSLPPGGKADVVVSWDTKGKSNRFVTSATFVTNDPERPALVLLVGGEVVPPVVMMPEVIEVPLASSETPTTASFVIFSPDKADFVVESIAGPPDGLIAATQQPVSEAELQSIGRGVTKAFKVDVVIEPGLPLGSFRAALVLATNHPQMPKVEMPVIGRVSGPITTTPETVAMSRVPAGRGGSATLTLSVRGQEATSFEVAEKPDRLTVEIRSVPVRDPAGALRQYRMTVAVPPGTATGPIDGTIVLKTDHPNAATLRIPVRVLVSSAG